MKTIIITGLLLSLSITIVLLGYLCYRVDRLKHDAYRKGYYDACHDYIIKNNGNVYCGQYWKYKHDEATKMLDKRLNR
jgi:hypothetical protein